MLLTKRKAVEHFHTVRPQLEKAVHEIQNQYFFSLVGHWKTIIFVFRPYLSSQRFLVKRPKILLTAMNANQQATKTIFYVDSRKLQPQTKTWKLKCLCHNKRCARARAIECGVNSLILKTILGKNPTEGGNNSGRRWELRSRFLFGMKVWYAFPIKNY